MFLHFLQFSIDVSCFNCKLVIILGKKKIATAPPQPAINKVVKKAKPTPKTVKVVKKVVATAPSTPGKVTRAQTKKADAAGSTSNAQTTGTKVVAVKKVAVSARTPAKAPAKPAGKAATSATKPPTKELSSNQVCMLLLREPIL